MDRFCAARPMFSVPWLQRGRCGVNDTDDFLLVAEFLVSAELFGESFLNIISMQHEHHPLVLFGGV